MFKRSGIRDREKNGNYLTIEVILKVDLYGTAVLLEEVGKVIKEGGAGIRQPVRLAYACSDSRRGRTAGNNPRRRIAPASLVDGLGRWYAHAVKEQKRAQKWIVGIENPGFKKSTSSH